MEQSEYENTPGQDSAHIGAVQGEGDYQAARAYRHNVETYLEHADVAQAAREAAPRNRNEARELEQAEVEGRSHAKGESLGGNMRKTKISVEGLQDAIRQRPVASTVMAGVLGYLIGRIGHRS